MKWTPEDLLAQAERLDAIVVDIRYVPKSNRTGWSKFDLMTVLKRRYIWSEDLGNVNYMRQDLPIVIHYLERGLKQLIDLKSDIILLCYCPKPEKCHRVVLKDIKSARFPL